MTPRAAVEAWAKRAGRTPFYVYDLATVTAQVAAVRAVLPPSCRLHYALKANPFPPLVKALAAQVDGFDVASGGELALALESAPAGGFGIGFAGPGKSLEDIRAGVKADVLFQCESRRELREIGAAGQRAGVRPRVALRINPDLEFRGAGQRMGGGPRPFGIDSEQAPAILREMATLPVEFAGFHFYAGSQMLEAATVVRLLEHCYDTARTLAAHAPGPVRELNLGGGFGVPYFAHERALDLAPIRTCLESLATRAAADFPEARLVLELGRYLVAEAGRYVMRVVDRKVSRGQVFLICDGGMHHHLAAAGLLGQVLRRNFPIESVKATPGATCAEAVLAPDGATAPLTAADSSAATETVTLCGPLCTPLDVLGERVVLPVAEEGDFIVIGLSGAYGATASPRGFLSHPGPVELLVP